MAFSRKQRNAIIIYGITLLILGLVFYSVWRDMSSTTDKPGRPGSLPAVTPIRPSTPPTAGTVVMPFTVGVKLAGPVPADITETGMPPLILTVTGRASQPLFLVLEQVAITKTDYVVRGMQKGIMAGQAEVIPAVVDGADGAADAVIIKPGETRTFEYDLSRYFSFGPGTCDLGVILKPGAVNGSAGPSAPVTRTVRVEIKRGTRTALLAGGGASAAGRAVATVNDQPISAAEFLDKLIVVHGEEMLQNLTAEKAVWQALEKAGIRATAADITYAIEFERRTVGDELKGVPFEEYLASFGYSVTKLRQSKGFLLRVAIRHYLSTQGKEPTEDELLAFFNRQYHWYGREEMVRARKLVVALPEQGTAAEIAKAREDGINTLITIRREIDGGRIPFNDAVRLFSQDVRARVSEGEMDPFRRYSETRDNDVARIVAEVGFRLKPGEISTPLEVDNTLLLLQVIETVPAIDVLFKNIREQVLKDFRYNAVSGPAIQAWIAGLVKASTVTVAPEYKERFEQKFQLEKMKHYETELIGGQSAP